MQGTVEPAGAWGSTRLVCVGAPGSWNTASIAVLVVLIWRASVPESDTPGMPWIATVALSCAATPVVAVVLDPCGPSIRSTSPVTFVSVTNFT